MKHRTYWILPLVLGWFGAASFGRPADADEREPVELSYDIVNPSANLAKSAQKKKDYVTAILLNEAILKRDPTDHDALQRMVKCYEELGREDQAVQAVAPSTASPDDKTFADLPGLIPENPDVPQLAKESLRP